MFDAKCGKLSAMKTHLLLLSILLTLGACDCDKEPVEDSGTDAPVDTASDSASSTPELSATKTVDSEDGEAVQLVALSEDGAHFLHGTSTGLYLTETATETSRQLIEFGGNLPEPGAAAWRGNRVAAGTFSELIFFDADALIAGNEGVLWRLEGRSYALAFSNDGNFIYRVGRNSVEKIDTASGSVATTQAIAGSPERLVLAGDTLWVSRLSEAVEHEIVELDPDTLAIRNEGPNRNAQIDGDAGALFQFHLSEVRVGVGPEAPALSSVSGIDMEWGRTIAGTTLAILVAENGTGVHLVDFQNDVLFDTEAFAVGDGISIQGETIAVGGASGVGIFDLSRD